LEEREKAGKGKGVMMWLRSGCDYTISMEKDNDERKQVRAVLAEMERELSLSG
jgi:hypothetical protein